MKNCIHQVVISLAFAGLLAGFSGCLQQEPTQQDTPEPNGGFASTFVEGATPASQKKQDQVTKLARKHFADWLNAQGEKNVVNDDSGVGIEGNSTRLCAFLYGASEHETGITVEVEFRVVLPNGREIQEFVAARAATQEEAIQSCLKNFTISSVPSIYACFMNPKTSLVKKETIIVNGHQMTYATTGITTFLGTDLPSFDGLPAEVKKCIASASLDNRVHWIKLVYGQRGGESFSNSVGVDNQQHDDLTQKANSIAWPAADSVYLAKQFIILQPVSE